MNKLGFRSPKTQVRASPIDGHGLFTVEAFSAAEIVAAKGGFILALAPCGPNRNAGTVS